MQKLKILKIDKESLPINRVSIIIGLLVGLQYKQHIEPQLAMQRASSYA